VKSRLSPDLLIRCRALRANATNAEYLLWQVLRDRQLEGLKFRRQHPYVGYILDFYCHEKMLAIELDGGGHNEPGQERYDEERSSRLREAGIRVLRFWNNDVMHNLESVVEEILANI